MTEVDWVRRQGTGVHLGQQQQQYPAAAIPSSSSSSSSRDAHAGWVEDGLVDQQQHATRNKAGPSPPPREQRCLIRAGRFRKYIFRSHVSHVRSHYC